MSPTQIVWLSGLLVITTKHKTPLACYSFYIFNALTLRRDGITQLCSDHKQQPVGQ